MVSINKLPPDASSDSPPSGPALSLIHSQNSTPPARAESLHSDDPSLLTIPSLLLLLHLPHVPISPHRREIQNAATATLCDSTLPPQLRLNSECVNILATTTALPTTSGTLGPSPPARRPPVCECCSSRGALWFCVCAPHHRQPRSKPWQTSSSNHTFSELK
ncbi:hypothetical protein KC19_4G050200 [Ceratodon purpureus]|uniref:Uncharacterized protein n=1 Tax=Ceratodon purpureus TaxID=3225 RepID=A0A8T0I6S7_CERPU|nr:hypothetical protein KC19_4G050200 [Ceratodon purpureus]